MVAYFRQIPSLHLGIGSRADWVANILLFIHLAFFWLGLLWSRSFLGRVSATLAVMAAGVALAVGMSDIIAESINAQPGPDLAIKHCHARPLLASAPRG